MRLQANSHRPARDAPQHEVVFIKRPLDTAFDTILQNLIREVEFLTSRSRQTNPIDRLQRVHHGAYCSQSASDEDFGVLQRRDDGLGKFQEESLALACRLTAVSEGDLLIGTARELDEVKFIGFEGGAQLPAFLSVEAFVLELDTVNLDAQDEGRWHASTDLLGYFKDETRAILQRPAILISAMVRGWGEELTEKIAT